MAHIIPSSRSLVTSTARSRVCQSCYFQLTRPSLRTAMATTVGNQVRNLSSGVMDTTLETQKKEDDVHIKGKDAESDGKRATVTWEGLQWVGSRKYIWENARIKGVDRWAPSTALPIDLLESQLLCALVDTLIIHNGDATPRININKFPILNESEFHSLFPNGIEVGRTTNSSQPILETSKSDRRAIMKSFNISLRKPTKSEELSSNGKTSATYDTWQSVPLEPLSLRFTFLKRVFQRTGHRLPDSSLAGCTTAGAVHSFLLAQQTKKRKLGQELQEDDRGFGLRDRPNVDLKETRVTRVHQDMSVGRWKLTREELAKKGLPEFWDQIPLNERRRDTASLK